MLNKNIDWNVVNDFGDEWTAFNHESLNEDKLRETFNQYFRIFPFDDLPPGSEGFDMGCGSGRWAKFVAPMVGTLNCVEPSSALEITQDNLKGCDNVAFFKETVSDNSLGDGSQDFGYCLGVLHHIPNTEQGIRDCARKLKSGAPFLLYLYYNFEHKPLWFKLIWKMSDIFRRIISRLPGPIKRSLCTLIGLIIYYPLARSALVFEKLRLPYENIPLSDYRNKTLYQMRNDALDRFGTRLERRFSKEEISAMLVKSGFERITFSTETPYWLCVAYKS